MHCLEFRCEFFPQYFVVVIVVVIILVIDREGNKLMREKVTRYTAMFHSFEGESK